jgi:hypothetical protein
MNLTGEEAYKGEIKVCRFLGRKTEENWPFENLDVEGSIRLVWISKRR